MPQIYENLIVGAGISGAIIARCFAEKGERVQVIDLREHIAGNMYDYRENDIMIHKYGPHIFHTNNKSVWDFISRFTKWRPYQHKVLALVDGKFIPIPFNLNSLRMVFPKTMADKLENKLISQFGFNKKVPISEFRNSDDEDLKFLAEYVYEKIFQSYTQKQWGGKVAESVLLRVPIYIGLDDRYFQDKYQGIPLNGYAKMIQNMLSHSNISVNLNMPYDKDMKFKRLFWTGSIDEFFDYKFGILTYRSVTFDLITYDQERFQPTAQVNYPTNYDFTRITEYKHFLQDKSEKTIVSYEYPHEFEIGKNDRQYPVENEQNRAIYEKYKEEAKEFPNVHFLGRLGDYKYYDMDKAALRSLELAESLK